MVIVLKPIVKEALAPNGINTISELKKELEIPVYAIGGITPTRVEVLQTVKADGIAVMSGIFSAKNAKGISIKLFKEM